MPNATPVPIPLLLEAIAKAEKHVVTLNLGTRADQEPTICYYPLNAFHAIAGADLTRAELWGGSLFITGTRPRPRGLPGVVRIRYRIASLHPLDISKGRALKIAPPYRTPPNPFSIPAHNLIRSPKGRVEHAERLWKRYQPRNDWRDPQPELLASIKDELHHARNQLQGETES